MEDEDSRDLLYLFLFFLAVYIIKNYFFYILFLSLSLGAFIIYRLYFSANPPRLQTPLPPRSREDKEDDPQPPKPKRQHNMLLFYDYKPSKQLFRKRPRSHGNTGQIRSILPKEDRMDYCDQQIFFTQAQYPITPPPRRFNPPRSSPPLPDIPFIGTTESYPFQNQKERRASLKDQAPVSVRNPQEQIQNKPPVEGVSFWIN